MGQRKKYERTGSLPKIKVKPRIPENDESSKTEMDNLDCFQFSLEAPTALVQRVSIGEEVFGDDFSNTQILIMNKIGALGHVPEVESTKLSSIANKKQVTILGIVIEKIGQENLIIEVCL